MANKKSGGQKTFSIEEIEAYKNRELVRPKISWVAPALIFLSMIVLPFFIGCALIKLTGISNWVYLITYILIDILLLRILLISIVKCYQRYASDRLRRYCLCIPSCSEYAIAVLKKYLLVVAVYKIIYRLKVTCDGEMKVDMP